MSVTREELFAQHGGSWFVLLQQLRTTSNVF